MNKGILPLFIIGAIFMNAGLLFLIPITSGGNLDILIKKGKILKDKDLTQYDEVYAAEVTRILPEAFMEVDNNTKVYLIEYTYDDGQLGYVGLQSKDNHKHIQQLIELASSQESFSYWIPVSIMRPEDQKGIANYRTILQETIDVYTDLGQSMTRDYYLSISEYDSEVSTFYLLLGFWVLFGLAFIVAGILKVKKNRKVANELLYHYPELNDGDDILLTKALLHIPRLKLIVYKDHLITYYYGFFTFDLRDAKHIYRFESYLRYGLFVKRTLSQLVCINHNDKKHHLSINYKGKQAEDDLNQFFSGLSRQYPNIIIEY